MFCVFKPQTFHEDLRVHYDLTVRDADGTVVQFLYGDDGVDVTRSKQLSNFGFMANNYHAMLDVLSGSEIGLAFPDEFAKKAVKHHKKALVSPHKYDPALSKFQPDVYFGSISEQLSLDLAAFLKKDNGKLFKTNPFLDEKKLSSLINLKYFTPSPVYVHLPVIFIHLLSQVGTHSSAARRKCWRPCSAGTCLQIRHIYI